MDSIKLIFVAVPGMFLVVGLILMAFSLAPSFRRRRAVSGWSRTSAVVTGNLHGTDGPASNGRNRFAPTYEFTDPTGKRWLGQSDIYGFDQAIIGTAIPVVFNPANPAESTQPVLVVAKGRLSTGLIMVLFGAGGVTMFATLLW